MHQIICFSNNEQYKQAGSRSITKEITHRCLRWLGPVPMMLQHRIPKVPSNRHIQTKAGRYSE